MALTQVTTQDIASSMKVELETIDDLRAYAYSADKFRPPGVVIGQPDLDFADSSSGFCNATWLFPLSIIVSRNQDYEAQADLARLVVLVANTLDDWTPSGVFSVEPLDARPLTVTVSGQELPAYLLNVRVRA